MLPGQGRQSFYSAETLAQDDWRPCPPLWSLPDANIAQLIFTETRSTRIYSSLTEELSLTLFSSLQIRVLLSSVGELRVEAHPTRPFTRDPLRAASISTNPQTIPPSDLPSPIFSVYLDTRPTPASAFTAFKTTSRAHYDAARARRGIADRRELREVLLYNERGEVSEGSVRNVAFWRGDGWVTPPERSGGLPGTVRRYLLEKGLVKEGIVRVADVRVGEYVLLSNGWDGTVLGRVVGD